MRVLKWNVPVDDQPHRIGPGPVVHVGCQDSADVVQVWTEEPDEPSDEDTVRLVQVFGTGQPIGYEFATHAGSVIARPQLVWHVYNVTPLTEAGRGDGGHPAEKDAPRIFNAAIFRHTYNPWSGKCGCGEGPFSVPEHAAHVESVISPGTGALPEQEADRG